MIEQIFLNVMESISESRNWLMPLLLGCVLVVLADEVRLVLRAMREEMDRWSS